jgi:hypothetical protein
MSWILGLTSITVTDQAIYAILLLIGLVICFFGYRIFRVFLFLAGLQVGFILGLWLGGMLFSSQLVVLIVAILAGIVLALISGILLKIGGFLAGAGVLAILAAFVLQLLKITDSNTRLIVFLVAAIIGGLLGVFAVKPFLILVTAVNGAYLVADSVLNLVGGYPASQYLQMHGQLSTLELVLLLAGVIILAILGAMVQFRAAYRKKIAAVPASPPPPPPPPSKPAEPPAAAPPTQNANKQ